ncbi:MAG TPA: DUF58 domain-containing protein, partial [Nannocystaceae bacterium]|nr:DUF58 domain-containing protein [Nannocystaceae bacterium]
MRAAPHRRSPWARLRDGFPLTLTGAFVLGGSLWALMSYGLGKIDLVLLVVGAVGLFACAVGLVSMLACAAIVRARLPDTAQAAKDSRHDAATDGPARPEQLEIECGHAVPTRWSIPYPWWLSFGDVRWTWVEPAVTLEVEAEGGRLHEHVVAARRGAVATIVRRIVVGDVLGLWRIAWEHRQACNLRFLPSTGALSKVEVVRGMTGGDDISDHRGPAAGDPYDLRHYNPGDPIRFVLWSLFARSRKLIIRQPERAISLVRQTNAYLVAGPGDEPAAAAARLAVQQGALGEGWSLGADGIDRPATSARTAMDAIARSAHSSIPPAAGLAAFLGRARPDTSGRIVLFVPGRVGPWVDLLEAACAAHRRNVDVFVCIDAVVESRAGTPHPHDATYTAAELAAV